MTTTTYDGLIRDLKKALGADVSADNDLSKARDLHEKRKGQNIRSLLERVASINEELPDEAISAIAGEVALAVSNGNKTIEKARKTEIKLALEQRTHASAVLAAADSIVRTAETEGKPKPNTRALALAGLRACKKGLTVDAWQAVEEEKLTVEKVPLTTTEKALKNLDAFEKALDKVDEVWVIETDDDGEEMQVLRGDLAEALATMREILEPDSTSAEEAPVEQLPAEEDPVIAALARVELEEIMPEPEPAAIPFESAPPPVTPSDEDKKELEELGESITSMLKGLI